MNKLLDCCCSSLLMVFLATLYTLPPLTALAQLEQSSQRLSITDVHNRLIPQVLLPCIHAAEVQHELGLSPEQIDKLETLLFELDQRWWPARNLDAQQQRATIAQLESELLEHMVKEFPLAVVQRLQQIELQAQGPRMMLRRDVASLLGLTPAQQQKFLGLAETTERNIAEMEKRNQQGRSQDYSNQLAAAKQAETASGYALLNEEQKQALNVALGTLLDFSKMQRTYAMAPELVASTEWIGDPIGSILDLRGKVVVVHFYAFQCINCRNNFDRYDEWVEKFKDSDVVFLGIQTPETKAEADADQVRNAAERDRLRFPVLIDLEHKNWKAWGNTMWPTVYVIDKRGYIRMWWLGELNWQGATGDKTVAEAIEKLLNESKD
ncbi:MAG TPA: redoxin domain-containing protein [Pirellulaceae bacterium]|nr:redoxin domain-containing protein [Pirellulaceae bacterium]HMO91334.1 redoxin domain-containing protein [Pirellulaceae bacterium]HMP70152.1 redoxin domain-containing protein [Pirellulaceae bacterium]